MNIPQTGYVGVGIVTESAQPVKEFTVDVDGKQTPILELPLRADMTRDVDDPEKCEYLVRVRWLETVDPSEAYWQTGMFANQNTACRLTNRFTLERLYQRFNVSEEDEVVVEGKAEISSEPPAQVIPAASPSAPSAPVS